MNALALKESLHENAKARTEEGKHEVEVKRILLI